MKAKILLIVFLLGCELFAQEERVDSQELKKFNEYYGIENMQIGSLTLEFTPHIRTNGNAGCFYTIKMIGDKGEKTFDAFFHPKAFRFYSSTNNQVLLVVYLRGSAFSGVLITKLLDYESGEMIEIGKKNIKPREEDNALYEMLFHKK